MLNRYRLPASGRTPSAGLWRGLLAWLSGAERAKRQLERSYQRRATRRLRDSGIARA